MEKDDDSVLSLANLIVSSNSMDPKDPSTILKPSKKITLFDFLPKRNFELMWDKQTCNGKYLIHAESYWKLTWDIFIFLSLVTQGIYVPFSISFDIPLVGGMIYYDFIVTCAFLLDIVFNFNTGFFKKGVLIMNRALITKHYICSWFFLDLLSSFPYNWVIQGAIFQTDTEGYVLKVAQLLKYARMPRFIKVLRLLRFAKMKLLILKVEDSITNEFLTRFFSGFRFLVIVFMLAHWNACLWYFIGAEESNFHPLSWVTIFDQDSAQSPTVPEKYITSLYWSITTLLTVGYGDIHAYTVSEKIVAMLSMILASAFYGYVIGSVHTFVERNTMRERKHREEIISMTNHMRRHGIPKELQFKVRSYLEYVYENQKNVNIREDLILNLLSEPLKDEIAAFIHFPAIKTCPIFAKFLQPQALTTLIKNLLEETYAPDDEIFEEGEKGRTMYFIIEGSVSVYYQTSKSVIADLGKGKYFGEIGFFAGHPRTASVRCTIFSDMLSLNWEKAWLSLNKDLKSQELLILIESICEDEDYTEIDVRCYICLRIGHVAFRCPLMISHKEDAKSEWLNRKVQGRVKINPFEPSYPKFKRKLRRVKNKVEKQNILGVKREPDVLYKNYKKLKEKADKYVMSVKSNSISTSLSEGSFKQDIYEAPSFYKYSVILSDSSNEDTG